MLVEAARGFACVFHRAFDDVVGSLAGVAGDMPEQELRVLRGCGFAGVLTSGGPGNAARHVRELGLIVERAPEGLEIVMGGGVRSGNVREMGAAMRDGEGRWLHSSCLSFTDGVGAFDFQEAENLVQLLGERAHSD